MTKKDGSEEGQVEPEPETLFPSERARISAIENVRTLTKMVSGAHTAADRLVDRVSRSRFFLLSGLGFNEDWGMHADRAPEVVCTLHYPAAHLRRVMVYDDSEELAFKRGLAKASQEYLLLEFERLEKNAVTNAIRCVNAIQALFACAHASAIGEDFIAYQIPQRGYLMNRAISRQRLFNLEKTVQQVAFEPGWLMFKLRSFVIVSEAELAWILFFLPTVLSSSSVWDACHFFEACCRDYAFLGDSVTTVLGSPEEAPSAEQERVRLEQVVLNAFKTVEALAGEPGKEDRFRRLLAAAGINHDEEVGFRGRQRVAIGNKIRWLQVIRDSFAGHGKRRRTKPVTFFEAMEAQKLAQAVLHRAIWHAGSERGRADGSLEETAYLLSRMLYCRRDWLIHSDPHLGRIPAELARTPGGLIQVADAAKKR